jgi:hypothetical protein
MFHGNLLHITYYFIHHEIETFLFDLLFVLLNSANSVEASSESRRGAFTADLLKE